MIPITRPLMDEREEDAVRRVVRSGWITQGPEVASFEADFAQTVGARKACAVSSCTAALHLALRAAGVGLEVMDTRAACRTYNILLSEDRRVGAALLMS